VKIKALSVFEGVIYHSWCVDSSHPCSPVLEVDAVLRDGDADAGPLLLPFAEYAVMVGADVAHRCLADLDAAGRIVDRMGVRHITFPLWQPGDIIRA
jgi:hypothetical protein